MDANNKLAEEARPVSPSRTSRSALLVLGMHRSGTSALARLLSLLGAALPEHLVGAMRGNETGHWEPERLVNLHDEMLAEAGSRWDDWRRFEPAALGPERLSHYKSEISRLISEEYGAAQLFVLKDPRLCRFVPLYEEVLGGMDLAPRFVLTYRNPISVLDSLAARDDMAASYASLVWLRHALDAEEATRGKDRVFVAYEEYLDDWRASAARISSALGLDWPRGAEEASREIDAYLSRDMRHHTATPDDLADDPRIGPAVRDAHRSLLALTADAGDAAALETLSRVKEDLESGQSAPLGPGLDDWRTIAARVFEEMNVHQNRGRLDREHLQRLAVRYQDAARESAAAKSAMEIRLSELHDIVTVQTTKTERLKLERDDLQSRLTVLHDIVTVQTTEISRLESEWNGVQARYAAHESALSQLSIERIALERQLTALQDNAAVQATEIARVRAERDGVQARHAALDEEHAKLKADLAALRNSTSWRLTRPIRAAKHLANDPRGTIAFLRAKGLDVSAQPATPQPIPTPAADSPPTPAGNGPLPGMEKLSAEDAARVEAAFDADFYLGQYPDIAASGIDPFGHYMLSGWKEGRDPSPAFSTGYYLQQSPDLAKAGVNPFLHWVLHGVREKRPTLPFRRRLELLDYAPKVSAIVPNYNHARFLEQRIDSILAQTYENVEVLLLDDCSTDDSRAVIERYRDKHPGRVRALFNEENSGNVFRQWRKGIENSSGELIWICESDDFCEPDFLEGLVKNFKDRSVNIAFGRIQFSDRDGNLQQGMDQYRESAEPGIWDAPLTRPAQRWFAGGFGVNNVIANVGGCVFRRQSLPEPVWRETENYSILGDWFLYCHLSGGGQVSYEPSSVAYFRQHGGNTSVVAFVKPDYYEEHERLMTLLRRRWGVPDETVEAFYGKVAYQYVRHNLKEKLGSLESHCDKRKLLAEKRERPHVLIAFLGFHPGGGEVFPIHLANALRAQGHIVSMLAFDMGSVNQEMLATLDPAIPVYDAAWVEEYGADRFLADAGISLIHSHMVSLEWFFFEKCRIETKIPYLVTLHGSYEASGLGDERLLRILLGVTHFVYTASKNLEPFRVLPLSERIFTKLGNAMPDDPRPFPKTRRELGIGEDAVVFTLVARGIQRKGWRAAITAFLRLRDTHPDREMHLLLCGDGEETDRHFTLHGDDPDITFLGYQSRINGLYRLSDVAVVPTRFAGESFPLSILQALKTGTPVIATRVGEIGSMIEAPEGAAGIVIENQRDTDLFIESLREAMADMLDAPERQRYARAAKKKSEAYSMDKVATDYVALYETLLAKKGR